MTSRLLTLLSVVVALTLSPASRAEADAHGIVGGIIGGMIGAAIHNNATQNRRVVVRPGRPRAPAATSAQRTMNREMQTALNYFGFPAGSPDGVIGRRTRGAVSGYQAFIGMPATGQITETERTILNTAYARGLSGDPQVAQLIARDPQGTKALLLQQRDAVLGGGGPVRRTAGYPGLPIEVSEAVDEIAASSDPSAEQLLQRAGFIQLADLNGDGSNDYIIDTALSGSSFWCSTTQCKSLVFVSTANGYVRNDLLAFEPTPASFECIGGGCRLAQGGSAPAVETAPDQTTTMASATSPALPVLPVLGTQQPQATLSSHCNRVGLVTNANGGPVTLATFGDPSTVINEMICASRSLAIDEAERSAAALPGVTPAQITEQCSVYGSVLKQYVDGMSLKPRAEVIQDVGNFVLTSGIDPAQLAATARICLGTGYRVEDLDVAQGSALLLVVLGEPAYSEVLGHHLALGFGGAQRTDLAAGWYSETLRVLGEGQPPALGGSADHTQLLEAAFTRMTGGSTNARPVRAASPAKLPTFRASE